MASYPRVYPRIWGELPLPPGTIVRCRVRNVLGRVMDYDCSVGQFPVCWPGGMWESCIAGDVTVVESLGTDERLTAELAEVCVFQYRTGSIPAP